MLRKKHTPVFCTHGPLQCELKRHIPRPEPHRPLRGEAVPILLGKPLRLFTSPEEAFRLELAVGNEVGISLSSRLLGEAGGFFPEFTGCKIGSSLVFQESTL